MRKLTYILLIFFNISYAQDILTTDMAVKLTLENNLDIKVSENILQISKNNSSISAINVSNGNIAALIKIKDFEFRLGLMQEHFNENYLESYKYPKSTFEGNIELSTGSIFDGKTEIFDYGLVDENFMDIIIKGQLTIKGVTKDIIATGKIKKIENDLNLISSFSIKLSDFNVRIPKVVFMKIDEVVKINLNYNYELQN